jgi:hypothetical protein
MIGLPFFKVFRLNFAVLLFSVHWLHCS